MDGAELAELAKLASFVLKITSTMFNIVCIHGKYCVKHRVLVVV